MFVRNALRFGSFLFVLSLVDKLLLSKVSFRAVVLDAGYLKALLTQDNFLSLIITNAFSKEVGNDRVSFIGYLSKKGQTGQMQRITLETRDTNFASGRKKFKYSSYSLTREAIEKLTSAHPQAVYFLLNPVQSLLDEDYISFQVLPADRTRTPFPKQQHREDHAAAEMPMLGEGRALRAMRAGGEEAGWHGDFLVAATLNPSPPAVASYEEEV